MDNFNSQTIRIIPRLDIKSENLVKGIRFEGIRVLGKPEWFAELYYEEGADEIIFNDVVASLYGRNSLKDIVKKTAEEIFIPMTVCGGIRSIADISSLLKYGADKVAINTAAIHNPKFLGDAVKEFGSQCIVLYVEAKKRDNDKYEALCCGGREQTGVDVFEWVKKCESLGVGEILLTSVDQDGTGLGFDIKLIEKIVSLVDIPVIASSGAGKKEDILNLMHKTKPDAVSVSSILHYGILSRIVADKALSGEFGENVNIDFIANKDRLDFITKGFTCLSLIELKEYLSNGEIKVRSVIDAKDCYSRL
ncbi:MAG: imidazole glycerol phosphate synthase subunit HisF [Candidatus Omnitrophica bacterium]|nr:imidazole glycerol phosphate synthase subunit HisF [Candidatus Omnitrophota bacterium]